MNKDLKKTLRTLDKIGLKFYLIAIEHPNIFFIYSVLCVERVLLNNITVLGSWLDDLTNVQNPVSLYFVVVGDQKSSEVVRVLHPVVTWQHCIQSINARMLLFIYDQDHLSLCNTYFKTTSYHLLGKTWYV